MKRILLLRLDAHNCSLAGAACRGLWSWPATGTLPTGLLARFPVPYTCFPTRNPVQKEILDRINKLKGTLNAC